MPAPARSGGDTLYHPGDRVRHATLGDGTVLLIFNEGKKMTIRFDSGGDKTFVVSTAPLTLLKS